MKKIYLELFQRQFKVGKIYLTWFYHYIGPQVVRKELATTKHRKLIKP